jgi:hypothetical protein
VGGFIMHPPYPDDARRSSKILIWQGHTVNTASMAGQFNPSWGVQRQQACGCVL